MSQAPGVELAQLLGSRETLEVSERVHGDLREFLGRFPPDSADWEAITRSAASCDLEMPPAADVLAFLRGYFVIRIP